MAILALTVYGFGKTFFWPTMLAVASDRFPLELITTHRLGLKDTDLAIRSVGGTEAEGVIHVSLLPWR